MTRDINDVKRETGKTPDPFDPRFADDATVVEPGNVVPIRPDAEVDDGSLPMKPVLNSAFKGMQERLARGGGLAGEAVGLTRIDDALDGWQRGRFYVIGGRTGMGKSIVGLNVANRAAEKGLGVDFISLEMPVEEQAVRALLCQSKVPAFRLKNNTVEARHWSAMTTSINDMIKWPWAWNDKPGVTVEQIEKQIRRCKAKMAEEGQSLFMVVVDHIQKIRGSKGKDRRTEMVHITDMLKNIAKSENVCVVGLAQVNRGTETRGQKDRRPRVSELQESGSIEQEADAIMLLYREDYYRKERDDYDNILEVSMPKIRGGEPTFAKLRFTGECYRIDNLASGESES